MGSLLSVENADPNRVTMNILDVINSVKPHPQYNADTRAHDIGLIKLPRDAPINGIYYAFYVKASSPYMR